MLLFLNIAQRFQFLHHSVISCINVFCEMDGFLRNSPAPIPTHISCLGGIEAPHPGGGTPIYFLYRDVLTVRVSFSGSSVLNRVYNFTFSCLKQGCPRKSSPFLPLQSHNFGWVRVPLLECMETQTYVPFVVFWIWPAWSSLQQGKKLQHFL